MEREGIYTWTDELDEMLMEKRIESCAGTKV